MFPRHSLHIKLPTLYNEEVYLTTLGAVEINQHSKQSLQHMLQS